MYWTEQKTTLCTIILLGKGYSIFIIMVILRKLWEFLKSDSKLCFSYPVLVFALAFLPGWLGAAQIAGEQWRPVSSNNNNNPLITITIAPLTDSSPC